MSKSWPTLIDIKVQEDSNKVQDEGSWSEELPKHTLVPNSSIHKLSKIVLSKFKLSIIFCFLLLKLNVNKFMTSLPS